MAGHQNGRRLAISLEAPLDLIGASVLGRAVELFRELAALDADDRIRALNAIRLELHRYSPLQDEPVDCVQWIPAEQVFANDYNPNAVAPPEMRLLEHSISEDGYTQPIVAFRTEPGRYEVVDGFHRNRVGRESAAIRKRLRGHLPLSIINAERTDRGDRIAATIRHNRARGKHKVEAMSDIVVELKRRNWSDEKIGKDLGMDPDEVLRLTQISGLAEMFADREFSVAWEHTGEAPREPEDSESELNLEWMNDMIQAKRDLGWHDRTPDSSVLYGEDARHLGSIQRSRFRDEWFWYAYTRPISKGRAATRDDAKAAVEACHE